MKIRLPLVVGVIAAALVGSVALAQGLYTNGLPAASNPLTGVERIPADTQLSGGRSPQTEYVTVGQLQGIRAVTAATLSNSGTQAISGTTGYLYPYTLSTPNNGIGAPTNLQTSSILRFILKQDSTGSRTVEWDPAYKWAGGSKPTLTTTAGRTDIVTCVFNNLLFCDIQKNYN